MCSEGGDSGVLGTATPTQRSAPMLTLIIVIALILLLLGGLPSMNWNAGRNWGYAPSGILGLILVVVVVLAVLRYI